MAIFPRKNSKSHSEKKVYPKLLIYVVCGSSQVVFCCTVIASSSAFSQRITSFVTSLKPGTLGIVFDMYYYDFCTLRLAFT